MRTGNSEDVERDTQRQRNGDTLRRRDVETERKIYRLTQRQWKTE